MQTALPGGDFGGLLFFGFGCGGLWGVAEALLEVRRKVGEAKGNDAAGVLEHRGLRGDGADADLGVSDFADGEGIEGGAGDERGACWRIRGLGTQGDGDGAEGDGADDGEGDQWMRACRARHKKRPDDGRSGKIGTIR